MNDEEFERYVRPALEAGHQLQVTNCHFDGSGALPDQPCGIGNLIVIDRCRLSWDVRGFWYVVGVIDEGQETR